MTHSRPVINTLLDDYGLHPRRDLGQNFVADPNTVRKIAALSEVGAGDHVVEIGAGLGSLTLALADTGASVTAVEVDRGLVRAITTLTADIDSVRVVEGDALQLDWDTVLQTSDRWTLVANLPYNIATPLVCDILDTVPAIDSMLVMVQREVAERFAATPGTKAYGAVSVKVAFYSDASIVGHVPASVFVPRPKVESALVRFERHRPPPIDPEVLFPTVQRAFGQRRKMLRRSLADVAGPETFERAAIDGTRRPETLDLAEWVQLAAEIGEEQADALQVTAAHE